MQRALIVFAKVPGLNVAKARIAAEHGAETAARIYDDLLSRSCSLMRSFRPHVFYTGADDPGRLYELYDTAQSFVAQTGEDLGARMANAALHFFRQAYPGVVIVGCDCPELTPEDIDQAFAALEKGTDIVLGPAEDGGYYLVGLKSGREAVFGLSQWGTPDVLERSLAIARARGWKTSLVGRHSDIDTMEAYAAWKVRDSARKRAAAEGGDG